MSPSFTGIPWTDNVSPTDPLADAACFAEAADNVANPVCLLFPFPSDLLQFITNVANKRPGDAERKAKILLRLLLGSSPRQSFGGVWRVRCTEVKSVN